MKTFAYITDAHLDEDYPLEQGAKPKENLHLVLADVATRNINTVVFGGDIGETISNEWFFHLFQPYKLQMTLGNHDIFEEVRKYYVNDMIVSKKELYYSYEENNLKYIFLDSSSNQISSDQCAWLEQELRNNSQEIICFIHHPILAIPTPVDVLYPLHNRDIIKSLFERFASKVTIFSAHYHMSDKRIESNITQFVTPSVSYQMEKSAPILTPDVSTFGYRIVQITEDCFIKSKIVMYRNGVFIEEEDHE
jgi:Icc protein